MYVGNLSWNATENDVRDLFATHGNVTEVNLPADRTTGRPRGFAFVTMDSAESMQTAIRALNGKDWMQRKLDVSEARPREERAPSGSGWSGGGGGGGGSNRDSGGGRW
ncbi:MAG: RNA recognition motif domain-containing protein [Verrucomicrobium sp.]